MKNSLSNLPPFYVGQKVVYITGIVMPKDSIHVISDIMKKECGCWIVGINNKDIIPFKQPSFCGRCNTSANYNYNPNGFSPLSFRPLEEMSPPLLTFTQIKETEKEEVLIPN